MPEIQMLDPAAAYALWAASYPPYAHNPLMQAEERAMLALLPGDLRGRTVLDAGCGSGRYLAHALRRGAGRALGVDLSAEMLAQAALLRQAAPEHQSSIANPRRTRSSRRIEYAVRKRSSCPSCLFVDQKTARLTSALGDRCGPRGGLAGLVRGSLDALPVRDRWADITICGLTIGHLEDLGAPLAELRRVTRRGGRLLCSDFHPIGHALGWRREFGADGQRYAVRHTAHLYSHWQRACARLGLEIVRVLEPYLDPADIPPGAAFDQRALDVPVALVFELRRE